MHLPTIAALSTVPNAGAAPVATGDAPRDAAVFQAVFAEMSPGPGPSGAPQGQASAGFPAVLADCRVRVDAGGVVGKVASESGEAITLPGHAAESVPDGMTAAPTRSAASGADATETESDEMPVETVEVVAAATELAGLEGLVPVARRESRAPNTPSGIAAGIAVVSAAGPGTTGLPVRAAPTKVAADVGRDGDTTPVRAGPQVAPAAGSALGGPGNAEHTGADGARPGPAGRDATVAATQAPAPAPATAASLSPPGRTGEILNPGPRPVAFGQYPGDSVRGAPGVAPPTAEVRSAADPATPRPGRAGGSASNKQPADAVAKTDPGPTSVPQTGRSRPARDAPPEAGGEGVAVRVRDGDISVTERTSIRPVRSGAPAVQPSPVPAGHPFAGLADPASGADAAALFDADLAATGIPASDSSGAARAAMSAPGPTDRALDTPRDVAMQIAGALREGNHRTLELRLHPEELGRVQLTMHHNANGALTVALTVERADTLDMMRRNIDLLGAELRQLGNGSVDFSFQGGAGNHAGRDSQPTVTEAPTVAEQAAQATVADASRAPVPPWPRAAANGIDLRL